jgi:hypothetical protein
MLKNPHNLIERKFYWFRYKPNDGKWFKAKVERIDDGGHVWLRCTDPAWRGVWTKDFEVSETNPVSAETNPVSAETNPDQE